jgi:transcriptional regulator NrdR family protein
MHCPTCQSSRVYPSRLRSTLERIRQRITERQPYRCHACNWRGWREVEFESASPSIDVTPEDLRTGRAATPLSSKDVDQLDPA